MALQVSLLSDPEAFKALEREWNELVSRMDHPEVFYRWEWNWLSHQHLRRGAPLFILLARDGGRLLGIAPLCVKERRALGKRLRVLETIVPDIADYRNIIVPADQNRRRVIKAMLHWLHENRSSWDIIELQQLSSRDASTIHLAMLAAGFPDLRCNIDVISRTPYLRYAKYPAKGDAKQIKWIRARRRALAAEGYSVHIGVTADDEFWHEFRDLYRQRWNGGPMDESDGAAFYDALRRALGPQNLLECSAMKFQGRSVAMHFGFRDARKVSFYMPVMDQRFRERRVGAVLADAIVEHYAKTHEVFDCLRGDEDYKYWWTDEVAVNFRLVLFHRDNLAAVFYNIRPALGAFVRSIALPGLIASRLRAAFRKGSQVAS